MARDKNILLEAKSEVPFWTRLTITEAKKEKLRDGIIMQAEGKVGHAGKVTANGRLYTKALVKREVARIQESITRRAVQGLSGHPKQGENPDPDKAAFIITGLVMNESGEVFAKMDVMDTPSGKIMATKAKAEAEVGFSSRGPGSAIVIKLTNEHSDYAENVEWQDKDIEQVNEDYRLVTYDHVIGQAVEDATMHSFNEDSKGVGMDKFEIEKMTDENWKTVLESEKFKTELAGAVAAQSKVDEKTIAESVLKILSSEKFLEDHLKNEGEDVDKNKEEPKEEPKEKAALKCAKCSASITSGSKFCPACGAKVVVKESVEPLDQTKFDSLKQENVDLKARLDELEKKNTNREEARQVEIILEEAFVSKPASVEAAIRKDLVEIKITPENAKEIVEKRIAHYSEFVKQTGGNLEESIDSAIQHNKDRDKDKNAEKKTTTKLTEGLDSIL